MNRSDTAPVDSLDRERTTWTPARERWAEQQCLVGVCIAAYLGVKDLPAIGAFNPDAQSRSPRWTPDSAHYAIDVENTVRRVIDSKPEADRPALWAAWESLLADDARIGKAEERLVKAIAPKFYANKLHPSQYFKPNRYPQKQGTR